MNPVHDAALEANPSACAVAATFGLAVLECGWRQELHAACACQRDLLLVTAGDGFEFEGVMESTPGLVAQ